MPATNVAANKAEDVLGDTPTSTTNKPELQPGSHMKALAWFGKQDLRLIDTPIPKVTDPTDALIRVTGTTICGSDLHLLHGDIIQLKKGDILGHEYMGIVEEVGSAVTKFKKGDRVVAAFNIGCGQCDYCKKKLYTMCDTTNNNTLMDKLYGGKLGGIAGYGHFGGGFAGGQAEWVRQPFADTNLLAIGDTPAECALYLSDIVCTAYHAVVRSGAGEGDTVGIWGLGPIGLHVAQWLRYKGVKRIIAVDNVVDRLALAKEKWGVEGINFDVDTDVVKKMHELSPGGIDIAIDCAAFRYAKSMIHKIQRAVGAETDTPEIVNEAIRSVKKFGTIALIADYALTCNGFLIGPVMEKGISLIGCGQAPVQRYWDELLEIIRQKKFDPLTIVTHRFKFEQIVEAYQRFDKKEAGIMKVFLETKYSDPPSPGAPKLTDVNAV
ncbi:hypothetical protein HDU86_000401 [Geranomyces michiganensis]|nr:hypothetical protein HDU86_000401 [Geranomyces michiganensis]